MEDRLGTQLQTAFQNDTFRVVWSYHGRDPLSESALSQLQPLRSGSRPVHLYESAKSGFPRQPPGALKWLVASNSVHLPPKHTLYWCTMIKLPELPGKHQVRDIDKRGGNATYFSMRGHILRDHPGTTCISDDRLPGGADARERALRAPHDAV